MAKTNPLGFRVHSETKLALEEAARDQRRSVSGMVEIILEDWLKANNYLPRQEKSNEPL